MNRQIIGLLLLVIGCTKEGRLAPEHVEQVSRYDVEPKIVSTIQVPAGFRAVELVRGLTFPSAITWDSAGRLHILESNTPPVPGLKWRIVRVDERGEIENLELEGDDHLLGGQMAVGLTFHEGFLYLSHETKDGSFAISRVKPEGGALEVLVRDLPAWGDHDANYIVFDREGSMFYGVGSATNSGVVSSNDPVNQKWLTKSPRTYERPCRDLMLRGVRFTEENSLTDDEGDKATTGAYQPYGESGATRVAGVVPCMGAIYRLRKSATKPELIAWGFRNPVALAFDDAGQLYVGMHGADVRGSRPIFNDPDAIYRVKEGVWYGWPEFAADLLPVTDPSHQPPKHLLAEGHERIEPILDLTKSGLAPPDRSILVALTKPHAALGGMTLVPRSGPFAQWGGQLLLSEMGDFKKSTDPVTANERAGFQIEMLNLGSGALTVFSRNRGTGASQPASYLDLDEGFERPVDAKFGPDGLLYVLDFGVFDTRGDKPALLPKTGKVFRIEPLSVAKRP